MLFASDIKNPPDLASAYDAIGTKASKGITSNYDRQKSRQTAESGVRGYSTDANSYAPERFAKTQGLDQDALSAALGGQLSDAGYTNAKADRDYNQQSQIANLIGNAMKPDMAQQIMGGLSGVGSAAGQYAALFNSLGGPKGTPYTPTSAPNASTYGLGGNPFASSAYNYDPYAEEDPYAPNMASLMYRGGSRG